MGDLADDTYRLAASLRRRHGEPGDRTTFTHVPVVLPPADALATLRASSLGRLLLPSGAVVNTPTTEWLVPVLPVRADDAALTEVGVTASTWEPPRWEHRAAEITVRLVYAVDSRRADQELRLHAAHGEPPSLSRWSFDHQRFQTGYEGERPERFDATKQEVRDLLSVVRRMTGHATS